MTKVHWLYKGHKLYILGSRYFIMKGGDKKIEALIKTKARLRLENKSYIIRWGNVKEHTMF